MYEKYQLHPPYGFGEEDFFPNFPRLSPWQPIKFGDLDETHIKGRELLNKQISKNKFQISLLKQKKTVNFHFSHFKSMENISCHSNQSSYPTRIKNTNYVETNVLSMFAKFQLHPPYGVKFFKKLPFMSPWQPIKLSNLDKIHIKREGPYTIKISVKTNFKYLH